MTGDNALPSACFSISLYIINNSSHSSMLYSHKQDCTYNSFPACNLTLYLSSPILTQLPSFSPSQTLQHILLLSLLPPQLFFCRLTPPIFLQFRLKGDESVEKRELHRKGENESIGDHIQVRQVNILVYRILHLISLRCKTQLTNNVRLHANIRLHPPFLLYFCLSLFNKRL